MKINILMNLLFVCTNTLLVAQEKTTTDSTRNIELPAAVVKEKKRVQLLDEKNLTLVPLEFIQRTHQTQDIPYILNTLSNVVVSSDAGTGTGYTDIKVRGTDLTRINVTMNGVPMNDPESQATFFVNTPDLLATSENVELVKGVGNSKNGNGSFGASLAINNLDVNNKKPILQFSSDFGTFNTLRSMAKISTGLLNDRFISTLRVSSLQSNGYVDRSSANLKALQWTSKYIFNKNTQLVFNYLKGKEITGQAWNGIVKDSLTTNRTYNELGMKKDGSFYNNQTDNYGQDYYQLFFDHTINQSWSIGSTLFYTKGKGYYEEYKINQDLQDYNLSPIIIGNDTISETSLIRQLWLDNDFYGGRLYANYFSKVVNGGIYLNFNQYKGRHFGDVIWSETSIPNDYRWYQLNSLKNDMNLYSMWDFKLSKKINVVGDLQFRNVGYEINGFRKNPSIKHQLTWQFLNPKLKINYNNKNHMLSFLAGIAQKEPNRDDIEASSNSIPKSEKMLNTEVNYIYSYKNKLAFFATAYCVLYRQ